MLVVDRLTKVSHFILVKSTYSASDVARVFIRDVVRLHGVLNNIVSDMHAKFTSRFLKELFTGLGTELDFSTAYRPQTDGKTERVNSILEDVFDALEMEVGRVSSTGRVFLQQWVLVVIEDEFV